MLIMYVEDNSANVSLVQRVARIGGHRVTTYTDGETALSRFDTEKPDLLLIDIQLAGEMSGIDVVKRLRATGHKLPVVALTAYAMIGDRERCIEAGCDGYLPKPLPITELVELFQEYDKKAVEVSDAPAPTAPVEVAAAPVPPSAAPATDTSTTPSNTSATVSTPTETPSVESSAAPSMPTAVPADTSVPASASEETSPAKPAASTTEEESAPKPDSTHANGAASLNGKAPGI